MFQVVPFHCFEWLRPDPAPALPQAAPPSTHTKTNFLRTRGAHEAFPAIPRKPSGTLVVGEDDRSERAAWRGSEPPVRGIGGGAPTRSITGLTNRQNAVGSCIKEDHINTRLGWMGDRAPPLPPSADVS